MTNDGKWAIDTMPRPSGGSLVHVAVIDGRHYVAKVEKYADGWRFSLADDTAYSTFDDGMAAMAALLEALGYDLCG